MEMIMLRRTSKDSRPKKKNQSHNDRIKRIVEKIPFEDMIVELKF